MKENEDGALKNSALDSARSLIASGEYALASDKLFALVKLEPLNATAFAFLSIALDYQGASKQAEQVWKTAKQLDLCNKLGKPNEFVEKLFDSPLPLSLAKILEGAADLISREAFSSAKQTLQLLAPELRDNRWLDLMSVVCIHQGEISELAGLIDSFPPEKVPMSLRNESRDKIQKEAISRQIPSIIIFALPKSASHYINTKLQTLLQAPQATVGRGFGNRIGDFVVPLWSKNAARGGCVVTNHLSAKAFNFNHLEQDGLEKMVVHVRDPRQALISWVYHLDNEMAKRTEKERELSISSDYSSTWSFEQKIDYHLESWMKFAVHWIEDWLDASKGSGQKITVLLTKYEDFVDDEKKYFKRIFDFYNLPMEYLKNLQIEKPKSGELHFRRGRIDEWRDVLTKVQQQKATAMIPRRVADLFGFDAD